MQQRAVQSGPQGQFVLLVDADGKVVPRPVKTGGMSGSDFLIAEGLKGGEQVIVNGLQKARPGAKVKPVSLSLGDSAAPTPQAPAPAAVSAPGVVSTAAPTAPSTTPDKPAQG